MTQLKSKTASRRYPSHAASYIRRLATLIKFAQTDLGLLDNGAWQKQLDELFLALYGSERERHNPGHIFNRTATRESVREAQRGLYRATIEHDYDQEDEISFDLAKQKLRLFDNEEAGFYYQFESEHFPTSVYVVFCWLLWISEVKRSDFRQCANEKCGRFFYPKRKPREKQLAYCSFKCANRVAAAKYRQRKKQKAGKRNLKKKKAR